MRVAVVIPHYDDQRRLDLVLGALARQTWPAADTEVIVADDGSPRAPVIGARPYTARVVVQEDLGFRASAARHLGAEATDAEVLAFVDGDTVPEPAYLEKLVAVVGHGPCGTVAVGRRRHAVLAGLSEEEIHGWFTGSRPSPPQLADPAWLTDAYAASDDLRDGDDRSYRFVISAVLALPHALYDAAGGFDPAFVGYGGEDWDLAHRCYLAGADFRHVSDAVAWHDGPDFGGRSHDRRRVKDLETLRLAHVLTDPLARGAGLQWRYPETAVSLAGPWTRDLAALAATASSLLQGSDAAVWCPDLDVLPSELADQPRLHTGPVPEDVRRRARYQVTCTHPMTLERPLTEIVHAGPVDLTADGVVLISVRRTRDLSREACGAPPAPVAEQDAGLAGVRRRPADVSLEAEWAGWA